MLEEVRADAAAVQDKADSAESALTSARHQLATNSDELACSESKVGYPSYTLLQYALSEALPYIEFEGTLSAVLLIDMSQNSRA